MIQDRVVDPDAFLCDIRRDQQLRDAQLRFQRKGHALPDAALDVRKSPLAAARVIDLLLQTVRRPVAGPHMDGEQIAPGAGGGGRVEFEGGEFPAVAADLHAVQEDAGIIADGVEFQDHAARIELRLVQLELPPIPSLHVGFAGFTRCGILPEPVQRNRHFRPAAVVEIRRGRSDILRCGKWFCRIRDAGKLPEPVQRTAPDGVGRTEQPVPNRRDDL